jgi:exonuclease VII large subunit
MGEQTSTALRPDEHTPHTLNQVYRQIVATAQGSVKVGRPLVAVRGQLGPLNDKGPSTKYFYEVPLSDDEGIVYLDVPKELVWRADIREGDYVKAVGVITTKCDRFTNYQLLFKVDVSHIVVIDAPTDLARHRDQQDKLALLKGKTGRTPFPQKPRLSLSVIHSPSGQVSGDFQHEIVKVADIIDVDYLPVNMTHAGAIAEAIEAAEGDILAIIRGGGPVEQFSVFEDPRVLNALACKNDVYRVLGLGHTNTMTLLDVVSDFAAKTPSLAGSHIREQIEWHIYPLLHLRSEQARNSALQAKITALETARALAAGERPWSRMKSLAFLVVGVVLGLIFGMWAGR